MRHKSGRPRRPRKGDQGDNTQHDHDQVYDDLKELKRRFDRGESVVFAFPGKPPTRLTEIEQLLDIEALRREWRQQSGIVIPPYTEEDWFALLESGYLHAAVQKPYEE